MSAVLALHLVQQTETETQSETETRSAQLTRAPGGRERGGHEAGGHEPGGQEPLWREVVGARLRHLRRRRGLTLVEAAARAGISPQYLSEVERGRKDPSSEVLAAITGALGEQLVDVTFLATLDLRRQHTGLAAPPPGEIRLSA